MEYGGVSAPELDGEFYMEFWGCAMYLYGMSNKHCIWIHELAEPIRGKSHLLLSYGPFAGVEVYNGVPWLFLVSDIFPCGSCLPGSDHPSYESITCLPMAVGNAAWNCTDPVSIIVSISGYTGNVYIESA
jgi:hypothetical protein